MLERVAAIALDAAGPVAAAFASASVDVRYKAPGDPVTSADLEANEHICRELARAFPGAGIVAEESAPEGPEALAAELAKGQVFFVDPLDGTREFVAGRDEFALMIGLAVGGTPVLGVVVLPTRRELFAGLVGGPAFVADASGSRRPLAVSATPEPQQARFIGSRSHPGSLTPRVHEALGARAPIERCGSVGVKIARLCQGMADVYLSGGRGVKKWDTCGPEALLRAAGGELTDLAGRPIDYADPTLELRAGLCASNRALHRLVLAAAARAGHA